MSGALPVPRARALALSVALAVAAAVVAGCSQQAAPTQAQYAAMADGVCKESDEKMRDLAKEHEEAVAEAAVTGQASANTARPERWMRARIIPAYRSMSARLKSIPPPEGDHRYLADMYADLDRLIRLLNAAPSRGRELISEDLELRDRFTSYGMEICGTV